LDAYGFPVEIQIWLFIYGNVKYSEIHGLNYSKNRVFLQFY